ncbi:MAG TPA: hypothetical protein VHF01_05065 [Candidatus Acidoferrum sp.]|nr:hypothetical protein [Candidatus Acidoferrum sp.]
MVIELKEAPDGAAIDSDGSAINVAGDAAAAESLAGGCNYGYAAL